MYFLLFSTISYVFIHILHIFLFKFLVLRILFLVEFNFNFFLNCFSINSIKCFFTIKFSFRTYIYHVYISVALIVFISIYVIDINTPPRWYHYFHASAIVFSYFFNFVTFGWILSYCIFSFIENLRK